MKLENRIKAFVILGLFLKQFKADDKNSELAELNEQFYDDFKELIARQKSYNGWFEKKNVLLAIDEIADSLNQDALEEWLSPYAMKNEMNKTIGVIMAGNIPLVGFHDFLTVLISGNKLAAKLSSNDNTLLPKIGEVLLAIEPAFSERLKFVEKLENFDAVIATGSDNTARYFKQYFGKHAHIIRKNRNSVGVVSDKDGKDELAALGKDVFQYYGLGCRSVSKIYLPEGFELNRLYESFFDFGYVIENNKYANNYDYNKAVYLLGNNEMLDNNFLLLKEEQSLGSPVGVLNYEFYEDIAKVKTQLEELKDQLQCVVSSAHTPIESIEFGNSQCPKLNDYADNLDTMAFVLNL